MTICPYDFGLWSVDLPSNVIIRNAPRRIHAENRRCHQHSPRSLLQCRQGKTRGWGIVYAASTVCLYVETHRVSIIWPQGCSSRLFLCFYYRQRVSLADLLSFGFITPPR